MTPKVNVIQASTKTAAISGITFFWANFTIEAFNFAWHIISTSLGEETCKAVSKDIFKVVCENCQEPYDDDEIHLIRGNYLCETCR